jgi:hypothetical protein
MPPIKAPLNHPLPTPYSHFAKEHLPCSITILTNCPINALLNLGFSANSRLSALLRRDVCSFHLFCTLLRTLSVILRTTSPTLLHRETIQIPTHNVAVHTRQLLQAPTAYQQSLLFLQTLSFVGKVGNYLNSSG